MLQATCYLHFGAEEMTINPIAAVNLKIDGLDINNPTLIKYQADNKGIHWLLHWALVAVLIVPWYARRS